MPAHRNLSPRFLSTLLACSQHQQAIATLGAFHSPTTSNSAPVPAQAAKQTVRHSQDTAFLKDTGSQVQYALSESYVLSICHIEHEGALAHQMYCFVVECVVLRSAVSAHIFHICWPCGVNPRMDGETPSEGVWRSKKSLLPPLQGYFALLHRPNLEAKRSIKAEGSAQIDRACNAASWMRSQKFFFRHFRCVCAL